jgi:hypothetical protein
MPGVQIVSSVAYLLATDLEAMQVMRAEVTPANESGASSTRDIYFDDMTVLVTLRRKVTAEERSEFLIVAKRILNRLRFEKLSGLPDALFIGHAQEYAYNPEMLELAGIMQTEYALTYRVPSSLKEWKATP